MINNIPKIKLFLKKQKYQNLLEMICLWF